jgi:oligopeptide transport system ATP-binding protein
MYLGKIVETGESGEITLHGAHPYTRSLISAIPIADPDRARKRERIILEGDVPSPLNPPSGCRFHPRCPYAAARCSEEEPALNETGKGHFVACHYPDS